MTAPAPSVDDVIHAIRAYAHAKGWTMYRVAKEARLRPTTLRDFHKPEWSPNTVTLRILRSLVPDDFDPARVKLPAMTEDGEDGPRPTNDRSSQRPSAVLAVPRNQTFR